MLCWYSCSTLIISGNIVMMKSGVGHKNGVDNKKPPKKVAIYYLRLYILHDII